MISKTIGFRGLAYFQTHPYISTVKSVLFGFYLGFIWVLYGFYMGFIWVYMVYTVSYGSQTWVYIYICCIWICPPDSETVWDRNKNRGCFLNGLGFNGIFEIGEFFWEKTTQLEETFYRVLKIAYCRIWQKTCLEVIIKLWPAIFFGRVLSLSMIEFI